MIRKRRDMKKERKMEGARNGQIKSWKWRWEKDFVENGERWGNLTWVQILK